MQASTIFVPSISSSSQNQSLAANVLKKGSDLHLARRARNFSILAQFAIRLERFITTKPTLQASGLPPKVEAWLPGTKLAPLSRASIAPIGKPPLKPLPVS
jgi:hypothetical protein